MRTCPETTTFQGFFFVRKRFRRQGGRSAEREEAKWERATQVRHERRWSGSRIGGGGRSGPGRGAGVAGEVRRNRIRRS